MRIAEVLVGQNDSMRAVLRAIDRSGFSRAFVADSSGRLVGAICEADVRRALLNGAVLESPAHPLVLDVGISTKPEVGRAEAIDLMHALGVRELPVVDDTGRVVGVHTEHALAGALQRHNAAVIMAGGRGTRLAPLTDHLPKPMVTVAGRPILERLVLHLVGSGINRIFISVNYLGEVIEEHFGDGSSFGCQIEYLREDRAVPLGTGGSLRLLTRFGVIDEPLLVMNGDLVTDFSVGGLLDAHSGGNVVATIATASYEHQVPFGVLEQTDGRLVRVVEKPVSSWPVNAGIYVLEPELISTIPPGRLFPITELLDQCLERGRPVGLWPLREHWQDIGMPVELAQARGQA
ncbi:dTDP-glucose pyrophosphorylase [Kribbella aluminosa]|uniref:dTDP-glucose pyrophosphorylase n=1 Tax=Kribbella aluminosa TaxID=416017 RepID=A0ABS4UDE2_9ACTN|nr:nucleotidyltransferase family protein [Kribbella aluminosa]MBP2349652.1 dTDP-glucose pyrophosphorylase [Kribbella aluminosa]